MGVDLSPRQLTEYLDVAHKAAARVSRDKQVIGESADVAVAKLQENWDHVTAAERQRRAWVATVARNHARGP